MLDPGPIPHIDRESLGRFHPTRGVGREGQIPEPFVTGGGVENWASQTPWMDDSLTRRFMNFLFQSLQGDRYRFEASGSGRRHSSGFTVPNSTR